MSDQLKKLREKRALACAKMREITDLAQKEGRDLTPDEVQQHDKVYADVEGLGKQITVFERQMEVDRSMATLAAQQQEQESRTEPKEGSVEQRQMTAFRRYLQTGDKNGEGMEELRALSASTDVDGGNLVAPQQFVTSLLQAVDNQVFIRQRATVVRVPNAVSLGVPSLSSDPADADWTTELATGSEDTSMKFGKRELKPNPLAKRIKVSKKLLRQSALPVEQIVMQRLAYKFAVAQEKGFLLGTGVSQPLGIFVASANGISTARDVSTDNTPTAITIDGLINAKFKLKAAYWPKAEWMFHPDAIKMLTKLKDSDGQYIWRESVRAGEPDKLLGRPINVSEYAPNTFTTGLYVGALADFSNYWIADALDLQVQRLTELYAEANQDGFIGRLETDGMPALEEAFVRVKLA